MSITADPVPSTDDVAFIEAEDPQLTTLCNSRDRYQRSGTRGSYWTEVPARPGRLGATCVLGSIYATTVDPSVYAHIGDRPNPHHIPLVILMEKVISDAAKQAIAALDEACRELFPGLAPYRGYSYHGAYIEALNERLDRFFHTNKRDVLRCYDYAIERRRSALA